MSYLSESLVGYVALETVPGTLGEALLQGSLEDVEILMPFIHSVTGLEQLEAMPGLCLISTRPTGYAA